MYAVEFALAVWPGMVVMENALQHWGFVWIFSWRLVGHQRSKVLLGFFLGLHFLEGRDAWDEQDLLPATKRCTQKGLSDCVHVNWKRTVSFLLLEFDLFFLSARFVC